MNLAVIISDDAVLNRLSLTLHKHSRVFARERRERERETDSCSCSEKMSGGLNRSSSGPSKNILPPQELLDDLCRYTHICAAHDFFKLV